MSLAIAYAMKKKGHKMARGGAMCAHGKDMCEMCHGGEYAEGGDVDMSMLNKHGADEVGAMGMDYDDQRQHERMISHPVENQSDHEDMVGRIMKQRMKSYSEGGQVANDTPPDAEFEDNQFDDLVKRDDMAFNYDSANSGDEIGDGQEDMDRKDIVARIMASRRKRDKMPRPA